MWSVASAKPFDPLGLATSPVLDSNGSHKARSGKEEHLYNPQTIHMLQCAVRNNSYEQFKTYSHMITDELGAQPYPQPVGFPLCRRAYSTGAGRTGIGHCEAV